MEKLWYVEFGTNVEAKDEHEAVKRTLEFLRDTTNAIAFAVTYVDEDAHDEEPTMVVIRPGKKTTIQLTEEQSEFWEHEWAYAGNELGIEDNETAAKYADVKTFEQWPELAKYQHWDDPRKH